MKLTQLRLHNFRCFGEGPTAISFQEITYLLGPNGSGKTAVLLALTRMFGFDRGMRKIQKADFHFPDGTQPSTLKDSLALWIEADFEFPELKSTKSKKKLATVPPNFSHMQLQAKDGVPGVRFRLDARLDPDGEIEEKLTYVIEVDQSGNPTKRSEVPKLDRALIEVHYLPARRDPSDHISYSASSLLGRVLRAANWSKESTDIAALTATITKALSGNEAVKNINELVSSNWSRLHKGSYYAQPEVSFEQSEIDGLLRHLTLTFSPGHEQKTVEFSRLGDGQKSLLYVSLVLSIQELGRKLLKGEATGWDLDKLQPAIFSFIAIEEPENSLSPHHLGRIVKALSAFASHHDAQAIVATHSPALLRRVPPERVRYLRLNSARETVVKEILLPPNTSDAHQFVREAVQAFPELYFSRLVVLGEGDSEEIIIPRLFEAHDVDADVSTISVVPLGGRHVNHFWRLLHGLEIPYVTLLDLDLGRFQGGWGRIKYAAQQLLAFPTPNSNLTQEHITGLPTWDGPNEILTSELGQKWVSYLESSGVFYSSVLDIDFGMLERFPAAYDVSENEIQDPDDQVIKSVLGKAHKGENQYSEPQRSFFGAYHKRFKLGSKPAEHLSALSKLDVPTLKASIPPGIARMLAAVAVKLAQIPE